MATASLAELIVPGSLLIPDDTGMTIAAAALPNGDGALQTTTTGWRAYQPATSGVHYPAAASDPFTVSFWMKPDPGRSAISPSSPLTPSQMILGVMDLNPAVATGATTDSTVGFRWGISFQASNRRTVQYHRAVGAASRNYAAGYSPNGAAMEMWTFRDPGNGTPELFINATKMTTTAAAGAGTQGTPGALSDPYFSIGSYPVGGGWASPGGTNQFARVALFNRALSDTEINDLYNAGTF